MIHRYTFADAMSAYCGRDSAPISLIQRFDGSATEDLVGRRYRGHYTTWEALDSLEPEAQAVYLALVARHESPEIAAALASDYARIRDPRGVEIVVENSDDDPFMISFVIHDHGDSGEGIADAWADRHGALMGGTWECPDRDPSFVYDYGSFYLGCFDELSEYNLDLSQYSEPEPDDFVVAEHAGACMQCGGDFREAERHLSDGPLFSELAIDPTRR